MGFGRLLGIREDLDSDKELEERDKAAVERRWIL